MTMYNSTTASCYDTSLTYSGTANSSVSTSGGDYTTSESPTDTWNIFLRQQEEIKRQIKYARYLKLKEHRDTLRLWWFNGLTQKPTLYYKPHPNRITFYKVLTCNRKGIGLRNRIRR